MRASLQPTAVRMRAGSITRRLSSRGRRWRRVLVLDMARETKPDQSVGGLKLRSKADVVEWLGRQDSNLRMPVPKTGALPLGDAPAGAPACRGEAALIDERSLLKRV